MLIHQTDSWHLQINCGSCTKSCSKIMHAGSRRYVANIRQKGSETLWAATVSSIAKQLETWLPMDFEMPRFCGNTRECNMLCATVCLQLSKLSLISTTATVREMFPLKWNMTTELAPSMSLSCSSESSLHNHHNHVIKHSLFTIVVVTHHSSTPGRHLSLHLPSMALTSKNGETNTTCTRLWCH